jgi:hypothetical protein
MSDEEHPEGANNLVVLPGGKVDEPDVAVEEVYEKSAAEITEAEKVEFLQYIRQGFNRQEAAGALGYRGRVWRSLTSPKSRHYDEEFANAYAEAIGSPESKLHFLERLREEGFRRAMVDSDRLLEKLLLVHDPDWQVLRQKDVNVNIRAVIQQQFRDLPTDLLEQLLAYLDARSGDTQEIEDAEFKELTPAGGSDGED